MTANIDDVAQTLAEYERTAITSGAKVQIDPPEFTADGATWSPFWTGESAPVGARVTVHRDGVPTMVYVAWAESVPAEESWRLLWLAKPMKLFGAYVVRAALRRAFREVIGDRREPDEDIGDPWAPAQSAARDWAAEAAAATTEDAVLELHAAAKKARAVTPALETKLRKRLAAVREAADGDPGAATATTNDEYAVPARPEPKDHLPPSNRAARRAQARKKGSKR